MSFTPDATKKAHEVILSRKIQAQDKTTLLYIF